MRALRRLAWFATCVTGDLLYCGHITSGFSNRARRTLYELLTQIGCADPPFTNIDRASDESRAHWVHPVLGCVEYHLAQHAADASTRVLAITTREDSSLVAIADIVVAVPAHNSRQFGGSLFEQASLMLLDALIIDCTQDDPHAYEIMSRRHTNLEFAAMTLLHKLIGCPACNGSKTK